MSRKSSDAEWWAHGLMANEKRRLKQMGDLVVTDLEAHPVWERSLEDDDEGAVFPVETLPVTDLMLRLVGTQVRLADGTSVWAILRNVSAQDAERTKEFLTVALRVSDEWFDLARYFDVGQESNGPGALARAMGRSVEQVFPIGYDVRDVCGGDGAALWGLIEKEPSRKRTDEERRQLVRWRRT